MVYILYFGDDRDEYVAGVFSTKEGAIDVAMKTLNHTPVQRWDLYYCSPRIVMVTLDDSTSEELEVWSFRDVKEWQEYRQT